MNIIKRITYSKAYEWFLRKIVGNITFRFKKYEHSPIDDWVYIRDQLRKNPNDLYVFSSSDTLTLSSILIRLFTWGKYSHAGVLYLEDDKLMCMHVMPGGLIQEPFYNFMTHNNRIKINRYNLSPQQLAVANLRICKIQNSDIKYDFEQTFTNGKDTLYCSELIHRICKDILLLPNKKILSKDIITPENVTDYGINIFKKFY